jgi:TPR repeat protein
MRMQNDSDLGEPEATWRAAALAGDADAAFELASYFEDGGDLDEAETYYRLAAAAGHAHATYSLGVLLWNRGKLQEAKSYYRQAAAAGGGSERSAASQQLATMQLRSRWWRRWSRQRQPPNYKHGLDRDARGRY